MIKPSYGGLMISCKCTLDDEGHRNIYVDYCWEDTTSFNKQENKLTEMKADKQQE
jgi:hypothetical protein